MAFISFSNGGTTRSVWGIGWWALKFAKGQDGRLANRAEFGVWKRASPARRNLLCPSLAIGLGDRVVFARRATPIRDADFNAALVDQAYEAWDYLGPNDEVAPFEPKASDWGILDGRFVAVDYANTQAFNKQTIA